MAYTKLIPRHTKDARVEEISRDSSHYLLSIPSGKADGYRLAQLDDYAKLRRMDFPLRFPLGLGLLARTSSNSIHGTWGFGLWNAVWFFGASEESYLSFRASTASGATSSPLSAQRGIAANGFIAQSFRAPRFHPSLILAGMALPFSRKMTRRLLSSVIDEDGIRLSLDPTQWHRYKLDWRENRVSFEVDEALVFESPVSPRTPLGVVIWIDNQYAAFTPDGRIGFGILENPEPAWLEIKDVNIIR